MRRNLGFQWLTVKTSGARVKAQIWLIGGKTQIWVDGNFYPREAFK